MENMTAYCGLACDTCPIHLATLEQDKPRQKTMRISIARICSEHYGTYYRPGDITDCDGCRADTGRLFSGCLKCEIRKCASLKALETCANCIEYACDKLKELFRQDPGAQTRLEEIRNAYKT
jgi:hypothetical protein